MGGGASVYELSVKPGHSEVMCVIAHIDLLIAHPPAVQLEKCVIVFLRVVICLMFNRDPKWLPWLITWVEGVF